MSAPDRLPPYSEEAERGVLGGIILDAARVLTLCQSAGLTVAAFYVPAHQIIFEALAAMDPKSLDLITIGEHLKANGELDRVGGHPFLERLVDATPTPAHSAFYIGIVAEKEKRRALIREAQTAIEAAHDETPLENILASRTEFLRELSKGNSADEFPAMTLADLQAYQPEPERDHIAGAGWLRRGAMTLFIGATGIGKSVAIEQVCISAAAGLPIFGSIAVAKPRKVVLLQAENDEETLKRDALSIVAGIHADAAAVTSNLTMRWVYALCGPRFVAYVAQLLDRERPDLLALDNYQAFSGDDINDSEAWQAWYRPIIKACIANRAALLLVDHTTKPKTESKATPSPRQAAYDAAGTSGKANGARCSCVLAEVRDEERRFRLRFGKNAERTGLLDAAGYVVRDLYLEHSDNPREPYWRLSADQFADGGKYDAAIRQALADDPDLSATKIGKSLGCSTATITRAKTRMGL